MTDTSTSSVQAIRTPIVVILGHVDHGKTSILDYIRKSKVAEGEAGGITQHIGAYQAEHKGKKITFIDTPGHEAFSAIRSRGTRVADVGVLVVAADEGVKPQTKEVIKILEESQTPFVIAVNKIDKPEANLQRVKQELAENNVLVEDWGGKIPIAEVSAKSGQGIDNLLEMILLLAELEELSANPLSPASGVIIESHLDNQKGNLATLLVLDGTLRLNDWVAAGNIMCRVKNMEDFKGKNTKEAGPSEPVVVLGWDTTPRLGQKFQGVLSKEEAEKIVQENSQLGIPKLFISETGPENNNRKTLNLIIKADVLSSLEAIDQVLKTIKSEEVSYKVINYGVGNISDGDIKSAISNHALVIGFHVKMDKKGEELAEREMVEVLNFDIIYNFIEKVREKMEAMLEPEVRKNPLGRVKVLVIFKKDERSQIIGGKVISGKVKRGAMLDVIRQGGPLMTGRIGQLQHNKVDVEEVKEGLECGIRFDLPKKSGLSKLAMSEGVMLPIREGDLLEVYEEEQIKRYLDS